MKKQRTFSLQFSCLLKLRMKHSAASCEGVIYALRCIPLNLLYVGSSVDFTHRRSEHLRKLRAGDHENLRLQRHWNQFGLSGFEFEILESAPEAELRQREGFWQIQLASVLPRHGYNSTVNFCKEFPKASRLVRKLRKRLDVEVIEAESSIFAQSLPVLTTHADTPFGR
jgi:hypothetical protein